MLTANEWAQNWVTGMTQSDAKMRAGAQRLQFAPGFEAVRARAKMRAKWLERIDSGDWDTAVGTVTLQQWQQAFIQKGIPRIADGVRQAQPKVQAYAQRAIPVYTQLMAQIKQMPKNNLQDSKARVSAWMDGMVAARPALQAHGQG